MRLILLLSLTGFRIANSRTVNQNANTDLLDDIELDDDLDEDETGLFYYNYLQKVLALIEEDNSEFIDALDEHSMEELRAGKAKGFMDTLSYETREKLDREKVSEVHRLRYLLKAKQDITGIKHPVERKQLRRELAEIADHMHFDKPTMFTEHDIVELIEAAANDLKKFDQERHKRFKEYEMYSKRKFEESLKVMTPQSREDAIAKRQARAKAKQERASKMNIPGSRAHLEEVWKYKDEMKTKFDPKIFFKMHDSNNDKQWDITEIESLFGHELSKAYPDLRTANLVEKDEQRLEMREYMLNEMDEDGNLFISYSEFVRYVAQDEMDLLTRKKMFETVSTQLVENKVFSKEEMATYKQSMDELEETIREKMETVGKHLMEYAQDKRKLMQKQVQLKELEESPHGSKDTQALAEHIDERELVLNQRLQTVNELQDEIKKMKTELKDIEKEFHKKAKAYGKHDEYADEFAKLQKNKLAAMANDWDKEFENLKHQL